jgi:hypothetical protein
VILQHYRKGNEGDSKPFVDISTLRLRIHASLMEATPARGEGCIYGLQPATPKLDPCRSWAGPPAKEEP